MVWSSGTGHCSSDTWLKIGVVSGVQSAGVCNNIDCNQDSAVLHSLRRGRFREIWITIYTADVEIAWGRMGLHGEILTGNLNVKISNQKDLMIFFFFFFFSIGKSPYFSALDDQAGPVLLEEPGHLVDTSLGAQPLSSPSRSSPHSQGSEGGERFSRKVFVGGLPPDIDEDEITNSFRRFGPLVVDWPHKAESKSYFPPKGYAFLLFQVIFLGIPAESSMKIFFSLSRMKIPYKV